MSKHALATSGVVKSEPAIVGMAAVWLLTQLGALVVTRQHWLGIQTWDSVTRMAEPLVTAVLFMAAGWLLRRVVTPAWKWLEHEAPFVADAIEDVSGVDVDKVLAEADAIFTQPAEPSAADSKEN